MKNPKTRQIEILKLIVENYIETWEITWSKALIDKHNLKISPATIRNDMASLEKIWLIYQPYNSAGRMPTQMWIRVFIDYLMNEFNDVFLPNTSDSGLNKFNINFNESNINNKTNLENINNLDNLDNLNILYKIISSISSINSEIIFAIDVNKGFLNYVWISNFLRKNKNILQDEAYDLIDILENKESFIDFIKNLKINFNTPSIFIWDEWDVWFKKCAIIVKPIILNSELCYIWIIWSIRMDYAFNISILRNLL